MNHKRGLPNPERGRGYAPHKAAAATSKKIGGVLLIFAASPKMRFFESIFKIFYLSFFQ